MRRALLAIFLFAALACGTTSPTTPAPASPDSGTTDSTDGGATQTGAGSDAGATSDGGDPDAGTSTSTTDADHDGLEDAFEQQVAETYLPFLALDANDGCPLGGIIFRVRKHPENPALLHVLMVHLYEKDCGLNGHVGDNELFAFTVDPAKPAPEGITALIAIAHQATLCERTTTCGVCNGLDACEKSGDGRPIVFASKDKHGSYVSRNACNFGLCLDHCAEAGSASHLPELLNVGEPDAPLVTNLTTQGFITAENGWTEQSLFDFNPWEPDKEFGKAGIPADDLVDTAADTEPCEAN